MTFTEFGICRLSIVPVRASASEKTEMISQLLFGDHYSVIQYSEDQNWLQIKIFFDGYIGWINGKQHKVITEEHFDQINLSEYKICTDVTATVLYNKRYIPILLGSILPIHTQELFQLEERLAFNGESKALFQKRDYDYLKMTAKKYLDAPYLWGGKSPFGIDCSGFVQQVFKICGYKLLRDASQQVTQGKEVAGIGASRPGDLAFFENADHKIVHVGIIMENNYIIHASGKVRLDWLDEIGILIEESRLYSHYFHSIRRIL